MNVCGVRSDRYGGKTFWFTAIEDIWLQAKTWVRRFCALIPSFSHLKWMFEWFIRHTAFDFPTLQIYGAFSEIKY